MEAECELGTAGLSWPGRGGRARCWAAPGWAWDSRAAREPCSPLATNDRERAAASTGNAAAPEPEGLGGAGWGSCGLRKGC